MRVFYILVLVVGVLQGASCMLTTYATPTDVRVARILSQTSEDWSIETGENLSQKLSAYDTESMVRVSLGARVGFRDQIYRQSFEMGVLIVFFSVVFSGIGLIRERKIRNLLKRVEVEEKEAA